ncbi:MAG: hypothetical protein ACRDXE_00755 [Acidimicrobiales bacterium]
MSDYPTGPPPYAPTPAARVYAAAQGRHHSDYLFGFWSALGWTILTLGIFGYYVVYQLFRRLRDHNRRRIELLDAALSLAWEEAGRRQLQAELESNFQRATVHLNRLRALTTEFREPGIWVILYVVGGGITQIIAFILLDQDLVHHDQAEGGVEHELAAIYGRLGYALPAPDPGRVKAPDRYVARVIVSVVTFGIYTLWWWRDQLVGPNVHFSTNWAQEDALVHAAQAIG